MARSEPSINRRSGAPVRCAIYTRKSSEDGLEQDFNSLHAQREACEAYIKSQHHEGWVPLAQSYDDGGISGGTMERPALQRLLADIEGRKIDVVVVYKVDRLTRSLADFVRIIDTFDRRDVAFVSITQQFNTTSSMGRLTLNVLLSFAQFEREVAGERIRDKIAASKRKGMWMGGNVPLGYDVRDRKLTVNEAEAETVRQIFRRYLILGSVRLLAAELSAAGIISKQRLTAEGRHVGGVTFTRGALYLLLQNRLYLGEITHKDQHYPGQHEPILDRELWDRAQAYLAANAADRRTRRSAKHPSLLAGLIFDHLGSRMSPTHAVKAGKRYRYYISRPLITAGREKAGDALRIPAAEIEHIVADRLCAWLEDGSALLTAIGTINVNRSRQLIARAAEVARMWTALPPSEQHRVVSSLIARVEVTEDHASLHVLPDRITSALTQCSASLDSQHVNSRGPAETIILTVPVKLHRLGTGGHLIVSGGTDRSAKPNAPLIKLLVRAQQLQQELLSGRCGSVVELAQAANVGRSYATRLLRLSWLAPEITQAILRGLQPTSLTAAKLESTARLPLDWPSQRAVLGFR